MLAIIQVAIGLIFVFSLLSILATTINGVVSNLLKWRAEFLKRGLIELLTDAELQAQFLAHPLIKMVQADMITPDETDNPARRPRDGGANEQRQSDERELDHPADVRAGAHQLADRESRPHAVWSAPDRDQ